MDEKIGRKERGRGKRGESEGESKKERESKGGSSCFQSIKINII
jgi:hypothetical protein